MKQKSNQRGSASHIAFHTSQKGITLIALVITIIVLLILAGVTINMVLGDNGIIGQAQHAKQQQENADKEQAIKIATGEAKTREYMRTLTQAQMEAYKKPDNTTQVFNFSTNPYNNNISEVKTFGTEENIKYLPIPKGFTHLKGTVDEGAVVVDGSGNEFVWVPVDEFSKFAVLAGNNYSGVDVREPVFLTDATDGDANSNNNKIGITPELLQEEYNAMAKSVETYGGFYVGRYETSWTGTKVASVANVTSMSGYTQMNEAGADWYIFYDKQKELYGANSSVTSGMIYGSQWDAIMDWMSDVINPNAVKLAPDNNFPNDSTGMGYYSYDENLNQIIDTEYAIATGSNDNYKVKNIYDLAGNNDEWTQEANGPCNRVTRGGDFCSSGFELSANSSGYDEYPITAHENFSSRLQLYIK